MNGTSATISNAWEVLTLFLIPIGGGIPGGVLLAQSRGIGWMETTILYFISDVILACVFEPVMLLLIAGAKRFSFLARVSEAFKKSTKKTIAFYGDKTGPLALVVVAFGVDPMTGRAVAVAAGHGFITGWMFAIAGDMLYFFVLMVSTLWLRDILGDGTWATVVILLLMMTVPPIMRRFRKSPKSALIP